MGKTKEEGSELGGASVLEREHSLQAATVALLERSALAAERTADALERANELAQMAAEQRTREWHDAQGMARYVGELVGRLAPTSTPAAPPPRLRVVPPEQPGNGSRHSAPKEERRASLETSRAKLRDTPGGSSRFRR